MRKIKEVLRLKWEKGFSARQIAKSCDVARSTVKDYLDRAEQKGLTWPLPDDLAMPRSFLGPLARPAKSDKTKILSTRCPASNRFVPDEVVDLIIIIYMSE